MTLLSRYWNQWRRYYLLDLRERHKLTWKKKGGTFEISVGDVIIIFEVKQPSSNWRLGKIERIIRVKDGHIRGASLRVITREGHHSVIERLLQKLFPLEIATKDIPELDECGIVAEKISEATDRPNGTEGRDRPDRLDRPDRPR